MDGDGNSVSVMDGDKCCRDGKLVLRIRIGMDTVCVVMDGNGLIFHYHAALYYRVVCGVGC